MAEGYAVTVPMSPCSTYARYHQNTGRKKPLPLLELLVLFHGHSVHKAATSTPLHRLPEVPALATALPGWRLCQAGMYDTAVLLVSGAALPGSTLKGHFMGPSAAGAPAVLPLWTRPAVVP